MTAAAKSKEEYYDAEECISDDKIVKFDITKNIIYGIDKYKYLLKFSVKEFVMTPENGARIFAYENCDATSLRICLALSSLAFAISKLAVISSNSF